MWKLASVSLLSVCVLVLCGFDGCNSPITQFTIKVQDAPVPSTTLPPGTKPAFAIPRVHTLVTGALVLNSVTPETQGTEGGYDGYTGLTGDYVAINPKVPAKWDHYVYFIPNDNFTFAPSPCDYPHIPADTGIEEVASGEYKTANVDMTNNSEFDWYCLYTATDPFAGRSTSFAVQGSLPPTLTLYAKGVSLSTAYGNPQAYLFGKDTSGNQIFNIISASSVSPDGSNATFSFPTKSDGSALPASMYGLALVNTNSDGSVSSAGSHFLSVGSSQPFTSPFGVAAQVTQYSSYDSTTQDPYGDQTCAGSTSYSSNTSTTNYPVVTQYTQGNVSINGYQVPVGPNPTAVQLYNFTDDSNYYTDGPCHYWGSDQTYMKNAIVANSGSNTVSILDLSTNSVVANVTVGQNPSSLALSSDQTVAYVANTGDGTVSRVDLNAHSQTANVYVGALPQSIAVSPDGTVWIGGNGFVSHVSSGLQLLGTYSTNGYTVSSLRYNTTASELIASSIDPSGVLYIQEIDDASTSNSGTYTLKAQRQLSTLPNNGAGPYYSATAQGSIARTQMATASIEGYYGSDSWLTASATANGFTLTNAVDHVGFVDGFTSSPVTSVAVDPSEYVGYLALPDSNQVITVYFPY